MDYPRDVAVVLSCVVAGCIDVYGRHKLSLNFTYMDWKACLKLAADEPHVADTVRAAYAQGKYAAVRDLEELKVSRGRWQTFPPVSPSSVQESESTTSQVVDQFLDGLREKMKFFVATYEWPVWEPPEGLSDQATQHLADLKMVQLANRPSLLLHNLGNLSQGDETLARVKDIFTWRNLHTTLLINTSGCGKTRMLLEGLCLEWGFYFSSIFGQGDMLGSRDFFRAITESIKESRGFMRVLPPSGSSDFQRVLRENRTIANRHFRQIIIARTLILQLFLEVAQDLLPKSSHILKRRWLYLQLRPCVLDGTDIFDSLAQKLQHASQGYLSQLPTLPSSIKIAEIFVVLDQAQFAARQLSGAFLSADRITQRSALGEVVSVWMNVMPYNSFVISGTDLSVKAVDGSFGAAILGRSPLVRFNTGFLDTPELQERYLYSTLRASHISFHPFWKGAAPEGVVLVLAPWQACIYSYLHRSASRRWLFQPSQGPEHVHEDCSRIHSDRWGGICER
ncbi:hypothetical protein BOTBODRAFT_59841 [Botryobasidium botryosum FD-172 SS1]|uniref:Uncharacterized protein n=1 Tax=Botryobasidium botryosum (strain FD-172 SS1) TaxID=930990 RepID=A0A067LWG8_BOTB1|nr:hypothetical protein BOTBODRAFT_59841 [Botryobasidium botryosum FD-172 SS1]